MQSPRLPRFKRTPEVASIQLTDRDGEIVRLVHQHRFLRSSHLTALIGQSPQALLRRLQLLYHHGYLERPRAQLDFYHRGGSRHIVYGLGNKGAALLKRERGSEFRELEWGVKNRAVARLFLEHALLTSDVMVAIELACREAGHVRLLTGEELSPPDQADRQHERFRWSVNVASHLNLGLIPDRVFALEPATTPGNRAYFFVEADRGTMPIARAGLSQSSFYRKLLAYEATWAQNLHRSRFGFHRFRVLTVPIHNPQGEVVAYAGRFPGEPGEGTPKYKLPQGFRKSLELFNIDRAIKEPGGVPLVIVEGFFDCMKLHQNGYRKVVALMGSSMSLAQEELIRKHTSRNSQVIVMLDEDDAGRAGREDIAVRLGKFLFVKVHLFEKEGSQPEHLSAEEVANLVGGAV